MLSQDALFTKMEHITAELEKGEKKSVLTGSNIWNKWIKKPNANLSEKKENTSASNPFKGYKWSRSTVLLKNNRAAELSTSFSFRRPLIGSVEQQNCVYSS